MPEPLKPNELALHFQTNWRALAPVATGATSVEGVVVKPPTPENVGTVPAVVQQAVADATPAGTELVIVKYVEAVDGKVSLLIDDATEPSPKAVHLVVNVISLAGDAARATTHQIVAEPRPHRGPVPGPPIPTPEPPAPPR